MPEKFIEERFDKLGDAVAKASAQVEADRVERENVRKALEEQTAAERHASKWWRRLTAAAMVASLLSLGAYFQAREARLGNCELVQDALVEYNRVLLEVAGDREGQEPRTEQEQEQFDIAADRLTVGASAILEDCS